MEIQQTRHQFYYKPDAGSGRNKHIRSWELLIQQATACHYHQRLNDRTIEGLCHCIRAWLFMNKVDYLDDGYVIIVDGRFALEVLATHRTNGVNRSTYRGTFDVVKIYSLWDFLTWFDRIFTINF